MGVPPRDAPASPLEQVCKEVDAAHAARLRWGNDLARFHDRASRAKRLSAEAKQASAFE